MGLSARSLFSAMGSAAMTGVAPRGLEQQDRQLPQDALPHHYRPVAQFKPALADCGHRERRDVRKRRVLERHTVGNANQVFPLFGIFPVWGANV